MDLEFKTKKLKKQCEDPNLAQRDFGTGIGNKASTSLKYIEKNKQINGFHELKGDRKNEFAVILKQPHRLVFTVNTDLDKEDIACSDISFIRIEEVTDYHGKNNTK
jgi:proteic killer suppression protein